MNINKDKLFADLKFEEGIRNKPYFDAGKKLTIGVGHNLTDKGLSNAVIDIILDEDIHDAMYDLIIHWPWIVNLSEVRQRVLVDMCFNMGFTALDEFKLMIMALQKEDWSLAASEMLDSKWALQVGNRAVKLSRMMETDHDN